jgi:hypothetical protein
MKNHALVLVTGLFSILFSSCTTPEKKDVRDEQLCYQKVTQGEIIITEDENLKMLIDSLVMNLHIKNDSVTGVLNWLPAQKDKMTGTLVGTIQDDVITAIYTYSAEGTMAKEEKILKLDSNRIFFKTGELEERNGVWTLKDKTAPFSESIPKILCR